MARIRRAPRAAKRASPSRIVGWANSRYPVAKSNSGKRGRNPAAACSNSPTASGSRLPCPHSSTAVSLISLSPACCWDLSRDDGASVDPLLLLTAGLAIDALFGDMPAIFRHIPHPVVLAGRAIAFFDRKLNREVRSEDSRRERGIIAVV